MKQAYGLLGKTLKHSFSKPIHEFFSNKPYSLIEVEDVKAFLNAKQFKGVNVTIPFKRAVIPYLDEVSEAVKSIGTVNTIVNDNNTLKGYNTDAFGFNFLLEYHGISLENKRILIVGNGSTSRTIKYVLHSKNIRDITIIARHPKEEELALEAYATLKNIDILINTTPVGMYPKVDGRLPIDLSVWPHLSTVIDVVYNPLKTTLIRDAERLNIKAINGLLMLVAQAAKSIGYFHNMEISKGEIIQYYRQLLMHKCNVVFIGMPMSGKSLYAKLLSKKLSKNFADTDQTIESSQGMPIKDIFSSYGEPFFRHIEQEVVSQLSSQNNHVIACGGGVAMNEENIHQLRQNGIIIFIDTSLNTLLKMRTGDRPLLKEDNSLELLFKARYNTYINMADIIFKKDDLDIEKNLEKLVVMLNEYIGIKRT